MRNWSISAGRLFGVELRVHLTFLLLVLFVFADSVGKSVPRAFALVGIVFGSVIAHELGHALMGRRSGARPRAIVLLPIGGVTLFDDTSDHQANPSRELRIAASGPLVNVVIGLIAAGIVHFVRPDAALLSHPWVTTANLPRSVVWVNLFLGLFNLLPAYPLDGGRVLRAVFSANMDPIRATRRAVTVSQLIATGLIILGFVSTPWFSMIGFFIFIGAQLEDRSAMFQSVLEHVRMQDVMLTDFRILSPADTLEDALNVAVHSLQDDFPVVRGSDMVGVISKQNIIEALRSSGNGYVQAVMNSLFEAARKEDSLAQAFRKITSRGMTMVPVVDEGRLVGIVTLQNLMHSMALVAEARRVRSANNN